MLPRKGKSAVMECVAMESVKIRNYIANGNWTGTKGAMEAFDEEKTSITKKGCGLMRSRR